MPTDIDGWKFYIRRAFGIPDAVLRNVVVEIISEAIFIPPPGTRADTEAMVELREKIGGAIYDESAIAGKDGRLDRFIMDRPARMNRDSERVDDVDALICAGAENADFWSRVLSHLAQRNHSC
jgi:hypothetical protein